METWSRFPNASREALLQVSDSEVSYLVLVLKCTGFGLKIWTPNPNVLGEWADGLILEAKIRMFKKNI